MNRFSSKTSLFLFFIMAIFLFWEGLKTTHGAIHLNEAIPHFGDWIGQYGVCHKKYDPDSLLNLRGLIQKKIEEVGEKEELHHFLEKSLFYLDQVNKEIRSEEKEQNYLMALRIFYLVLSVEKEDWPLTKKEKLIEMSDKLKTAENLLFKNDIIQISVPNRHNERLAIGLKKAKAESKYLKNQDGVYQKIGQLSLMTAKEVGSLDIQQEHPAWVSWNQFKRERKRGVVRYELMKKWLSDKITQKLNRNYHLNKKYKDFNYLPEESKRFVFFEDLKATGTSPKAKVKDAFGIPWKMKWSAEIQVEPFLAQLIMRTGSKISDIVYANELGKKGTTLILMKGKKEKDSVCSATNLETFLNCYKKAPFKIDLRPFIWSTGIITKENRDEVLAYYPHKAKGIVIKDFDELIGSTYITFKESSLKLSSKEGIIRGGATSFSGLGALDDRVARSLLLFNLWIGNGDTKDANNKGYLVDSDFPVNLIDGNDNGLGRQRQKNFYLETMHDLGLSLGGIIGGGGDISRLSQGKKFVKRTEQNLHFNHFFAFIPSAFRKATYADLIWMGRFIASISVLELREMAKMTHWPDFMQEVLVARVASRRDEIAKVLNLENYLPDRGSEIPTIEVDLSTVQKRVMASAKYNISIKKIESFCQERFKKNNGCRDKVVKKGKIQKDSLIVGHLEKNYYPLGLSWRRPRFSPLIPMAKKFPL